MPVLGYLPVDGYVAAGNWPVVGGVVTVGLVPVVGATAVGEYVDVLPGRNGVELVLDGDEVPGVWYCGTLYAGTLVGL